MERKEFLELLDEMAPTVKIATGDHIPADVLVTRVQLNSILEMQLDNLETFDEAKARSVIKQMVATHFRAAVTLAIQNIRTQPPKQRILRPPGLGGPS